MKTSYRHLLFISFLFAMLMSPGKAASQSTQQGIVMEYHDASAKTPLGNVAISAANAGSTVSDSHGGFTLSFRTLKAGDNIQFRRIEKSGYEVMNKEAVDAMRVGKAGDGKPLEIILCKSEILEQIRDGYRSVAAQRYEKQLKAQEAEVKRLRDEGKIKEEEYNARLNTLEEEYEDKLSRMDTYVDRFARIDLTSLDDEEKEIIALVKDGKIEEAISRYEEMKLTEKLRKTIEEKRQLESDRNVVNEAETKKAEEIKRLEESIERQIEALKQGNMSEEEKARIDKLIKEAQIH